MQNINVYFYLKRIGFSSYKANIYLIELIETYKKLNEEFYFEK